MFFFCFASPFVSTSVLSTRSRCRLHRESLKCKFSLFNFHKTVVFLSLFSLPFFFANQNISFLLFAHVQFTFEGRRLRHDIVHWKAWKTHEKTNERPFHLPKGDCINRSSRRDIMDELKRENEEEGKSSYLSRSATINRHISPAFCTISFSSCKMLTCLPAYVFISEASFARFLHNSLHKNLLAWWLMAMVERKFGVWGLGSFRLVFVRFELKYWWWKKMNKNNHF